MERFLCFCGFCTFLLLIVILEIFTVAETSEGYYLISLRYQRLTAFNQTVNTPVRLTDQVGPSSEWLVQQDKEEGGFTISSAISGWYLGYNIALPYAYLKLQKEPALFQLKKLDDGTVQILTVEKDEDEGEHLVVGRHPTSEFPRYVGLLRQRSKGDEDRRRPGWRFTKLEAHDDDDDERLLFKSLGNWWKQSRLFWYP